MSSEAVEGLRYALHDGQIVPYFQPQLNLQTGELYGFEVLARWQHPQYGLILPADFIPIAESGDLIGDLTDVVVGKAAEAAVHWPDSVCLAVNISALELRDWSLPERLQAAVNRSGFPMRQLIAEVTESALIGNIELAQLIANDLRAAGARLALDDFGSGYAGLRYLQLLPFEEIKIDSSFIASVAQSRRSREIVSSVISLGQGLGNRVVAEGIECQSQIDVLVPLGCEYGQGWHFGAAMSPDQVPAWIESHPAVSGMTNPVRAWEAAPLFEPVAQLRSLYENVSFGLCFVDRRLRIRNVNQRWIDLLKAPAYAGQTMTELMPELGQRLVPHLQIALGGGASLEIRLQVEEHGQRLVFSLHPVWTEPTEPSGVLVAVSPEDQAR